MSNFVHYIGIHNDTSAAEVFLKMKAEERQWKFRKYIEEVDNTLTYWLGVMKPRFSTDIRSINERELTVKFTPDWWNLVVWPSFFVATVDVVKSPDRLFLHPPIDHLSSEEQAIEIDTAVGFAYENQKFLDFINMMEQKRTKTALKFIDRCSQLAQTTPLLEPKSAAILYDQLCIISPYNMEKWTGLYQTWAANWQAAHREPPAKVPTYIDKLAKKLFNR